MSSDPKYKGRGNSGGDSWNSTHALLRPLRTPHPHYRTSMRGSTPDGLVELYKDDEDYGSELGYQHPAPYSIPNSQRASSSHSQTRSPSQPSTPSVDFGHVSSDSDHWSPYGLDFGGGLSSSSGSSSPSGLPGISHRRLGRGRLRRLNIRGVPSSRRKGLNIWKLLMRILGVLGLAWIAFGIVRVAASRVRIIYSHWMNIPVELLDLCKDAEWAYHPPTLLATNPSAETSPTNQLHSASAFFEISADEPLYLLSQGNFSYGTVEFLPATSQFAIPQDADRSESDQGGVKWTREQKIRVEVNAEYRDTSVFDWARVCMIGGKIMEDRSVPTSTTGGNTTGDSTPKQIGVMVWTPETRAVTPKEYQLHLNIKVYVPPRLASQHDGKRARLPSVITDLPTFEHRIGGLAPDVEFHNFRVKTQENIQVKSLRAESIFMQTVNRSVHGVMEAWSSIHVETSNAALDVNATLTPAPPHLHAKYTELFLKTSNAPLKSSVMLHADSRAFSRNVFKVTARTSKGPLVVVFPPIPPSTHTTGSVDSSYLDPHASGHDPSNARRPSELTSIVSSKTAKNSLTPLEGSGSGGEGDSGSDPEFLASPGKSLISTSPSSSLSSWPILRFDGHTTHGPAYVDLPSTFEGHFTLRASDRHRPRVVVKKRDRSDRGTEKIDGVDLVREVTNEVLEGGEVIKGAMRLAPAGPKKSELSEKDPEDVHARLENENEEQSPGPGAPLGTSKTGDGIIGVPVAWANVWTTNDRVELWV